MAYGELIPLVGDDGFPAVGIQRAAGSVTPPTPLYKQLSAGWHPLRVEGMDPLREQYMQVGGVTRQALSDEAFAMKPRNRGELASMMQIRANRSKEPLIDANTGQGYYVGVDYQDGGRRFGAASLPRSLGNDAVLEKFATTLAPTLLPPNAEVGKYGINKGGYPWMSWKGTYNADTMSSPFVGGRPEPAYVAPTTPTSFPSMEWKPSQQASREDYLENTWPGVRKSANDLAAQLVNNRMIDPGFDTTPQGQALIAKGRGLTGKLIGAQQASVAKQANYPIAQERFGHYPMREQAYGRSFMSPVYGETTDTIMEDYYKRAAAPGRYGVESFPNTFLNNMSDEWISRSPALTEVETIHPVYAAKYQGKGMTPGYYEGMTRSTGVDPLQGMVGTRPLMVSSQMSVNDKYPEGWGVNPPQTNLQTMAQDHAAALEMGDVNRANAIKSSMDNAMEGALSYPSETELGVYPPSAPRSMTTLPQERDRLLSQGHTVQASRLQEIMDKRSELGLPIPTTVEPPSVGESGKYLIGNVPQRIADLSTQVPPGTQFYREVPVAPRGQGEYYAIASEHERGLSGTPVTTYQAPRTESNLNNPKLAQAIQLPGKPDWSQMYNTSDVASVRIPGRPSRTSRIDNSRALRSGIELKPVTTIEGGLAQEAANRGFAPRSDEALRLELGSRTNSNRVLGQAQNMLLEPVESNDIVTSDLYRQGQLDNLRRQQMDPNYRVWQATPNDVRQAAVENLRNEAIQRQAFNNSIGSSTPVQLSIPEVAAIPASSSPSVMIAPRMMDVPSGEYRPPAGYGGVEQLDLFSTPKPTTPSLQPEPRYSAFKQQTLPLLRSDVRGTEDIRKAPYVEERWEPIQPTRSPVMIESAPIRTSPGQMSIPGMEVERAAVADSLRARAAKLMRMKGLA